MPTVRPRTTIYLWEFLLQLLDGEEHCSSISWLNRERGEFVLKDQGEIAKLWGIVKGRPRMDKIKLGRAMRYYYKKKLLAKVPRRKAVYRFVKYDCLKQKQSEVVRQEDFTEIDFTENPLIDMIDKGKNGDLLLPGKVDPDNDDMPLGKMLAGGKENTFTRKEGCDGSEYVGNTFGSMDNISDASCSFYDQNQNNFNMPIPTSDHYVPCSELPCISQQNYLNCYKNEMPGPITSYSMAQTYNQTLHSNGTYANTTPYSVDNGGPLASLLLNSILMSDQQITEDQTSYQTVPSASLLTSTGNTAPILSTGYSQFKQEPSLQTNFNPSGHFLDENEETLKSLREFERLLSLKGSF